MESEATLPHSQVPATCLYPEPAKSSPYPNNPLPEYLPNIILPSTPGSRQWSLSLRFSYQNPVHATYPAHLIPLDFITRTVVGEEYRSWSSSLWKSLYRPTN
jgi:hypothetical protein